MSYRLGLMIAAAGCGLSEKEFKDRYVESACAASIDCAEEGTGITFGSQEECEAFLGPFLGLAVSGCDYDGAAAKDCLADLESPDCEVVNSGGSAESCNGVYSGDACAWGTTGTTASTPVE
jgi:hypothetical protein